MPFNSNVERYLKQILDTLSIRNPFDSENQDSFISTNETDIKIDYVECESCKPADTPKSPVERLLREIALNLRLNGIADKYTLKFNVNNKTIGDVAVFGSDVNVFQDIMSLAGDRHTFLFDYDRNVAGFANKKPVCLRGMKKSTFSVDNWPDFKILINRVLIESGIITEPLGASAAIILYKPSNADGYETEVDPETPNVIDLSEADYTDTIYIVIQDGSNDKTYIFEDPIGMSVNVTTGKISIDTSFERLPKPENVAVTTEEGVVVSWDLPTELPETVTEAVYKTYLKIDNAFELISECDVDFTVEEPIHEIDIDGDLPSGVTSGTIYVVMTASGELNSEVSDKVEFSKE